MSKNPIEYNEETVGQITLSNQFSQIEFVKVYTILLTNKKYRKLTANDILIYSMYCNLYLATKLLDKKKQPFIIIKDAVLADLFNLSLRTFNRSRERLVQADLIEIEPSIHCNRIYVNPPYKRENVLINIDQLEKEQFYKIPIALFLEDEYKEISCLARLLYGVYTDAIQKAAWDGQFNANGEIYITPTLAETKDVLRVTQKTAGTAHKSLLDAGLIVEAYNKNHKRYIYLSNPKIKNIINPPYGIDLSKATLWLKDFRRAQNLSVHALGLIIEEKLNLPFKFTKDMYRKLEYNLSVRITNDDLRLLLNSLYVYFVPTSIYLDPHTHKDVGIVQDGLINMNQTNIRTIQEKLSDEKRTNSIKKTDEERTINADLSDMQRTLKEDLSVDMGIVDINMSDMNGMKNVDSSATSGTMSPVLSEYKATKSPFYNIDPYYKDIYNKLINHLTSHIHLLKSEADKYLVDSKLLNTSIDRMLKSDYKEIPYNNLTLKKEHIHMIFLMMTSNYLIQTFNETYEYIHKQSTIKFKTQNHEIQYIGKTLLSNFLTDFIENDIYLDVDKSTENLIREYFTTTLDVEPYIEYKWWEED